jgi:hypothetical protein
MRPELVSKTKNWAKGLEPASPEFNERLGDVYEWWKDMNTDKMAKFLEHDLEHGSRVRFGIVQKFMFKAHTPDHLRVLYRCFSWLQARWNADYNCVVTVPLARAAYRARSPDMALRILNSPWLRMLPSTNTCEILLRLCAELQEEKLFSSPNPINYKPFPQESSVNDWVDPHAVEEEEDAAASKSYGRHGGGEEKQQEEAKTFDYGGKDLDKSFSDVVDYVWDPRHFIRMEPKLYARQAEFFAAKGNSQKTRELLDKISAMPPQPIKELKKANGQVVKTQPLVLSAILPTLLLATGESKKVIEELAKLKDVEQNPRLLRLKIAALLDLGKNTEAYEAIKSSGNVNQYELVQTHLGKHDRVDIIREFYTRLEAEGTSVSAEMKEYLSKLDSLLGERPAPAAEAEAAPAAEAEASL